MVLARCYGLPAEQRQLQVRVRLRRPAAPGAQRGHRAAHHLLRLLGVPGGTTPASPDPLWPCVSVWELGCRSHPAGKDAWEAEGTRWVGAEAVTIGETDAGLVVGRLDRIARARETVGQGDPTKHSGPADFD